MLDLLREDKKAIVKRIHELAVDYYDDFEGTLERAEEIYHCLCLHQGPEVIEGRWIPGIDPELYDALEELDAVERAYLASRLNAPLPPEIRKKANLEDWERSTERRVTELLASWRNHSFRARTGVLRERKERTPGSPLYGLQAQALARLGKQAHAAKIVGEGLDSMAEGGGDTLLKSAASIMATEWILPWEPQPCQRSVK